MNIKQLEKEILKLNNVDAVDVAVYGEYRNELDIIIHRVDNKNKGTLLGEITELVPFGAKFEIKIVS